MIIPKGIDRQSQTVYTDDQNKIQDLDKFEGLYLLDKQMKVTNSD